MSEGWFISFKPIIFSNKIPLAFRKLQEKYGEKKRKLYHIFVNSEKAFNRVPRKAIEWALRRQHIPEALIRLFKCLYTNSKTKESVGVHQGSTLSPLLFVIVVEEVSKMVRRGGAWEMLYADNLVTGESKQEVEQMFVWWEEAMERRGLKVNMGKTKLVVSGASDTKPVQMGRYPCSVCGRGVGIN